jgi:hypothetical protein
MRPPGSNIRLERFVQYLKQHAEIVSTDDGIQSDSSDEHASKVHGAIVEIWQPGSNVSVARVLQQQKQPAEMVLIDDGIQID